MVQSSFSLKPYNTFGIDVVAKYFSSFDSLNTLQELLAANCHLPSANRQLLLGGGSNILFTQNFDGLVLKNEIKGIELVKEDENHFYVKASAGENWHQFVQYCIDKNYAGLENLSLIPGCVGASPMQNIGAYGVEIKDVFHELEAYHIIENIVVTFDASACGFGYRESVFKQKYKGQFIILNVTFKFDKTPIFHTNYGAINQELEKMNVQNLNIRAISEAVINIRSSKLPDPKKIGNAGSFFKNPTIPENQYLDLKKEFPNIVGYPVTNNQQTATPIHNSPFTIQDKTKIAAGWLIEQCGWKGFRENDAGVHTQQALVLVNYGHASGLEIYALSEKIIKSVSKKFGVMLEREVNIQ